MKDTIYRNVVVDAKAFAFDGQVAQVFDDMISRSVPLYKEVQFVTTSFAEKIAQPNSNIYDLGCSTGTTLIALCSAIADPSIGIIGVDNSFEMLVKCREKLAAFNFVERVHLQENDILEVEIVNSSLVILNYTLQFIPKDSRAAFLRQVYEALLPGGAIIITEKIVSRSLKLGSLMIDIHHEYKRRNGYSDLEIAQKRDAIENVLIPLTLEENFNMLQNAGFTEIDTLFKWSNFSTICGLKE